MHKCTECLIFGRADWLRGHCEAECFAVNWPSEGINVLFVLYIYIYVIDFF